MAEVSFSPGAPGIQRRAFFTFQGLWGNSISVLNIRYNLPQRVRFFCYLNDSQMSCPPPQTYQGELSLDFSSSLALPRKPVLWLVVSCLPPDPRQPQCRVLISPPHPSSPACLQQLASSKWVGVSVLWEPSRIVSPYIQRDWSPSCSPHTPGKND